MSDVSMHIHDARRPLNNISMQAELIKMLVESCEEHKAVAEAADKIIEYCQDCSEQLQLLNQKVKNEV